MEYLDVLDTKGNPTGEKKSFEAVHSDGSWHRAVHVWILDNQQQLLVQKRSETKTAYPGKQDISSAGQVDVGEDSLTSALRETNEELGASLQKEDLEYLFTVTEQKVLNNGTYINNEFQDVYLVTLSVPASHFAFKDGEVTEVRWIPFRELEKLIIASDSAFVPHPEEYKKLFVILHERYDR